MWIKITDWKFNALMGDIDIDVVNQIKGVCAAAAAVLWCLSLIELNRGFALWSIVHLFGLNGHFTIEAVMSEQQARKQSLIMCMPHASRHWPLTREDDTPLSLSQSEIISKRNYSALIAKIKSILLHHRRRRAVWIALCSTSACENKIIWIILLLSLSVCLPVSFRLDHFE